MPRFTLLGEDESDTGSDDPLLFAPVDEEDIFADNDADADAVFNGHEVTGALVLDIGDAGSPSNTTTIPPFGPVANLCSATLGAGILALPLAVYQTGVIVGLILLLLAGIATALSIDLLAHATAHSGYRGDSYEALVEIVLPKQARRSIEFCMLIFCLGCAVAYVMAVGDIMASVVGKRYAKNALVIVWATTMVPLSALRSVNSLSFASSIGIASIGTLIFCSALDYLVLPEKAALEDYLAPSAGWKSVLTGLPVVLFAFSCQSNACTIYRELECPEEQKRPCMRRVAIASVLMCGVLYTAISMVVLATFGSNVLPNLLANYHTKGSFMQVAVAAMALAVTLAFPLNIFPARVTLIGLFQRPREQESSNSSRQRQPNENLTQALLEDAQPVGPGEDIAAEQEDDDETVYRESDPVVGNGAADSSNDTLMHVGSTVFLTTLTLVLALVLPNISVVFGLLGGTTSSWLGFVIPGWLGVRTGRPWVGYSLMIIGTVIGIVTTVITVYDTLF